jgi:lysozyme family protein
VNFDQAFDQLLAHEGGYSDHAADPGGKTRYGITEAVARAAGYRGDMRELPLDLAKRIAFEEYWRPAGCDEWPDAVRFDVFDVAYNSGVKTAVKMIQRAAFAEADGAIGPKTRLAVKAMDPLRLYARISGARLAYLTDLPTWPSFGKGWARRIASNLTRSEL